MESQHFVSVSTLLRKPELQFFFQIETSVFEPGPVVTELDKVQRKETALENFQTYLRAFIQPLCGKRKYEGGTQFVFDALQVKFRYFEKATKFEKKSPNFLTST